MKHKKLLALYRGRIEEKHPEAHPANIYTVCVQGEVPFIPNTTMNHVLWMLGNMPRAGEQRQRWLGFVQGVLWLKGLYTLNDLREQVRELK